jgi:hypothetical protein
MPLVADVSASPSQITFAHVAARKIRVRRDVISAAQFFNAAALEADGGSRPLRPVELFL